MSTTIDVDNHSAAHPGEHHDHGPTDGQYFRVFWILVAITALEVSTYWWDDIFNADTKKIAVPALLIMMVIKFFMVALFFMHLKFDRPILRRIFYSGMVLAIAVYVVALSAMNFWQDSGTVQFNNPPPAVAPPTTAAAPGGGAGGG
ncbi:MAG: cytochrome C oxidase subunit IV family protein [Actinomycetes bacterium]